MGIRGSRCIEDENFIKLIGDPSSEIIDKEINDSNIKANLHIFDARCYSAALGNQLIGGGTESNASYRNSEVFFKNIENIHMVRDSYKKVSGLCNKYFFYFFLIINNAIYLVITIM